MLIRTLTVAITMAFFVTAAQAASMRASWYRARGANVVAHRSLPFGTRLRLSNPRTGAHAVGIVRDRGPFVRGRSLDVSRSLAAKLGIVRSGVTSLHVKVLGRSHRR